MGKILWLASYPKSGSTWVRTMLAHMMAGREVSLDEVALYVPGEMWRGLYAEVIGGAPEDAGRWAVHAARVPVQRMIAERLAGEGTLIVKTHSIYALERGLNHVDPSVTAGAIHVVRDPRDVVVSLAHHQGVTHEQAKDFVCSKHYAMGPEQWYWTRVSDWSRHTRSWLNQFARNHQCVTVKYEELYERPVEIMSILAEGLRLRGDPEWAVEVSSFERLREREREEGFREAAPGRKFFRRGRPGAWRDELEPRLASAVEYHHRPLMKKLGYL